MDGDERKVTRYSDGSQVISSVTHHHKKEKKTHREEHRYSSDQHSSPQVRRTFSSEDKEEFSGDPATGILVERHFTSPPKEGWVVQEKHLSKRSQQVHVRHEVTKNGETTFESKNLGFVEVKHSDGARDNQNQRFEDRYFHPIHTPSESLHQSRESSSGKERHDSSGRERPDNSRESYDSFSRKAVHKKVHHEEMKENLPIKAIDHYRPPNKNSQWASDKTPNQHGEERYELEEPGKMTKVERQWRQDQGPGHFQRMEIYKTESKGKYTQGEKDKKLYLDYRQQTPDSENMAVVPIVTSPPADNEFSKDDKQVRFRKTIEERREDRLMRQEEVRKREELERIEDMKQMEKRKDIELKIKVSRERDDGIPAKRSKSIIEFDEPDAESRQPTRNMQHYVQDIYPSQSENVSRQVIVEKHVHRKKVHQEQVVRQREPQHEIALTPPQNRLERTVQQTEHYVSIQDPEPVSPKHISINTSQSQNSQQNKRMKTVQHEVHVNSSAYHVPKQEITQQQQKHVQIQQPSRQDVSQQYRHQSSQEIKKQVHQQHYTQQQQYISQEQQVQKQQYIQPPQQHQQVKQQHINQQVSIQPQQQVQQQYPIHQHVQQQHHVQKQQEHHVQKQQHVQHQKHVQHQQVQQQQHIQHQQHVQKQQHIQKQQHVQHQQQHVQHQQHIQHQQFVHQQQQHVQQQQQHIQRQSHITQQEQHHQRQQVQQFQQIMPPIQKQESIPTKTVSFSDKRSVRDLEAKIDRAYWEYQLNEQEKEVLPPPYAESEDSVIHGINVTTIEGTDVREDVGHLESQGYIGLTIKSETVIPSPLTVPSSGVPVKVETPPQQVLLNQEPDWMKEVRIRQSFNSDRKIQHQVVIEDEPDFRKLVLKKTATREHSYDDSDTLQPYSHTTETNLKRASSMTQIDSVAIHSSHVRGSTSMSNISTNLSSTQFTHVIPVQTTGRMAYSPPITDHAAVTIHNASVISSPAVLPVQRMPTPENVIQEEPSWKLEIKKRKMMKSDDFVLHRMEVDEQIPEFSKISLKKIEQEIKEEIPFEMSQDSVTIESNSSFVKDFHSIQQHHLSPQSFYIQEDSSVSTSTIIQPKTSTPIKSPYREEKKIPMGEPVQIDVVTKMPIPSGSFSAKTVEDTPAWMLEAKKRKSQRSEEIKIETESETEPEWKNITLKKVEIDLKKPLPEDPILDVKLKHIHPAIPSHEEAQMFHEEFIHHNTFTKEEPAVQSSTVRHSQILESPVKVSQFTLEEKPSLRQLYQEKLLHLIEARHKNSQKSPQDGPQDGELLTSVNKSENVHQIPLNCTLVNEAPSLSVTESLTEVPINSIIDKILPENLKNNDKTIISNPGGIEDTAATHVLPGDVATAVPAMRRLKKWETISKLCDQQQSFEDINNEYCDVYVYNKIEHKESNCKETDFIHKKNIEMYVDNALGKSQHCCLENSLERNSVLSSVNTCHDLNLGTIVNKPAKTDLHTEFKNSNIFCENSIINGNELITMNDGNLYVNCKDKPSTNENFIFHSKLTTDYINDEINRNKISNSYYLKDSNELVSAQKENLQHSGNLYKLKRNGPIKSKSKKSKCKNPYSCISHNKHHNYLLGSPPRDNRHQKYVYTNYKMPYKYSSYYVENDNGRSPNKISQLLEVNFSKNFKNTSDFDLQTARKKNDEKLYPSSLYGLVIFSFNPLVDNLNSEILPDYCLPSARHKTLKSESCVDEHLNYLLKNDNHNLDLIYSCECSPLENKSHSGDILANPGLVTNDDTEPDDILLCSRNLSIRRQPETLVNESKFSEERNNSQYKTSHLREVNISENFPKSSDFNLQTKQNIIKNIEENQYPSSVYGSVIFSFHPSRDDLHSEMTSGYHDRSCETIENGNDMEKQFNLHKGKERHAISIGRQPETLNNEETNKCPDKTSQLFGIKLSESFSKSSDFNPQIKRNVIENNFEEKMYPTSSYGTVIFSFHPSHDDIHSEITSDSLWLAEQKHQTYSSSHDNTNEIIESENSIDMQLTNLKENCNKDTIEQNNVDLDYSNEYSLKNNQRHFISLNNINLKYDNSSENTNLGRDKKVLEPGSLNEKSNLISHNQGNLDLENVQDHSTIEKPFCENISKHCFTEDTSLLSSLPVCLDWQKNNYLSKNIILDLSKTAEMKTCEDNNLEIPTDINFNNIEVPQKTFKAGSVESTGYLRFDDCDKDFNTHKINSKPQFEKHENMCSSVIKLSHSFDYSHGNINKPYSDCNNHIEISSKMDNSEHISHGSPGKPYGSKGNTHHLSFESLRFSDNQSNNEENLSIPHGSPGKPYGSKGNTNNLPLESVRFSGDTCDNNQNYDEENACNSHGSPGKPFGGPGNPNNLLGSIQMHDGNSHGSPGKPNGGPGNPVDKPSVTQGHDYQLQNSDSTNISCNILENPSDHERVLSSECSSQVTECSYPANLQLIPLEDSIAQEHFIEIFPSDYSEHLQETRLETIKSLRKEETADISSGKDARYIELRSPNLLRANKVKVLETSNPHLSVEKESRYIVLRSPELPRTSRFSKESDTLREKEFSPKKNLSRLVNNSSNSVKISTNPIQMIDQQLFQDCKPLVTDNSIQIPIETDKNFKENNPQIGISSENNTSLNINSGRACEINVESNTFEEMNRDSMDAEKKSNSSTTKITSDTMVDSIKNISENVSAEVSSEKHIKEKHKSKIKKPFDVLKTHLVEGPTQIITKVSQINFGDSNQFDRSLKKDSKKNVSSLQKELVETSTVLTSQITDIELQKSVFESNISKDIEYLAKGPVQIISHIANIASQKNSYFDKLSYTILNQAILESNIHKRRGPKPALPPKLNVHKLFGSHEDSSVARKEHTKIEQNLERKSSLNVIIINDTLSKTSQVINSSSFDGPLAEDYSQTSSDVSVFQNELSNMPAEDNLENSRNSGQYIYEEPIVYTRIDRIQIKSATPIDPTEKVNILKELIVSKSVEPIAEISKIESPRNIFNDPESDLLRRQRLKSVEEPLIIPDKKINKSVNSFKEETVLAPQSSESIENIASETFESFESTQQIGMYDTLWKSEPIYENLPQAIDYSHYVNSAVSNFDVKQNEEPHIYESIDELENDEQILFESTKDKIPIYKNIPNNPQSIYAKQLYANPIYDININTSYENHETNFKDNLQNETYKEKTKESETLNSPIRTQMNSNTQSIIHSPQRTDFYISKVESTSISTGTTEPDFQLQKHLNDDNISLNNSPEALKKNSSIGMFRSMSGQRPAIEEHVIENVTHIQKSGKVETFDDLTDNRNLQPTDDADSVVKAKLIIIDSDQLISSTSVDDGQRPKIFKPIDKERIIETSPTATLSNKYFTETSEHRTISLPSDNNETLNKTQTHIDETNYMVKSDNYAHCPEILNDPSILLQSLKLDSNKEASKNAAVKTKAQFSTVYQPEQPSWIAQAKRNKYHRIRKMTWSTEDDPEETAALTDIVKKYEELEKPSRDSVHMEKDMDENTVPPLPVSPPPPLLPGRSSTITAMKVQSLDEEPEWITTIKKRKYHRKQRVTTEICGSSPYVEDMKKDDTKEINIAQYLDIDSGNKPPHLKQEKETAEVNVPKKLDELRREYLFFSMQPDWMMEAKRNKYHRMQKMKFDTEMEANKSEVNFEQKADKILKTPVKNIEVEKRKSLVSSSDEQESPLSAKMDFFRQEMRPESPQSPGNVFSSEPSWMAEVRRLKNIRERRASMDSQSSTSSKLNSVSEDLSSVHKEEDSESGVVIEHNKSPLEVLKMFDRESFISPDQREIKKVNPKFTEPSWLLEAKKHKYQRLSKLSNENRSNLMDEENQLHSTSQHTNKLTGEFYNDELQTTANYPSEETKEIKKLNTSSLIENTLPIEIEPREEGHSMLIHKTVYKEMEKHKEQNSSTIINDPATLVENSSVIHTITSKIDPTFSLSTKSEFHESVNRDKSFDFDNLEPVYLQSDKISDKIQADTISDVKSDKSVLIKLGTPQPYRSPGQGLTQHLSPLIQETATIYLGEVNEESLGSSDSIEGDMQAYKFEKMKLYELPPYQEPEWVLEAKKNKQKRMKKMGIIDQSGLDNQSLSETGEKYIGYGEFDKLIHEQKDSNIAINNLVKEDKGAYNLEKTVIIVNKTDTPNAMDSDSCAVVSKSEIEDFNLQPIKSEIQATEKPYEPTWVVEAKKRQRMHLEKNKITEDYENQIKEKDYEKDLELLKNDFELHQPKLSGEYKDSLEPHIYDSDSSSVSSEKVDYDFVKRERNEYSSFDEPSWVLEAKKNKLKRLQKMQARGGSYTTVFSSSELSQSNKDFALPTHENERSDSGSSTPKESSLKRGTDFILDSGLRTEGWTEAIKSSTTVNLTRDNRPSPLNTSLEKEVIIIQCTDEKPFYTPTTPYSGSLYSRPNSGNFFPDNTVENKSKSRTTDSSQEESIPEEPSWVAEAKKKQLQRLEKMKVIKQQKASKVPNTKEMLKTEDKHSMDSNVIAGKELESDTRLKSSHLETIIIDKSELEEISPRYDSKFSFFEKQETSYSKPTDVSEPQTPTWISEVKKNKMKRIQKFGMLEDPECVKASWNSQSESVLLEENVEKIKSSIVYNEEEPVWRSSLKENTYQRIQGALLEEKQETTVYSIKSNVQTLLLEEDNKLTKEDKDGNESS